jgi:deoxyribonuclease-4
MGMLDEVILGGHISTSGGIYLSPERAAVFGFSSFQIFSKNQMQWKAKPIPPEDADKFVAGTRNGGFSKLMVHASYLLNMGTKDEELSAKVKNGLTEELRRADQLQIDYLVVHPGSAAGTGENSALRSISNMINSTFYDGMRVTLLLETAAGQGSTVGYRFEQLASMIDGVTEKKSVGICFDTCHVFASGYDIKSPNGYAETFDQFDSVIGRKYLKGFHLNDSKKEMGSRVDRHEQIGKGQLGLDGVSNFINDERLRELPMILETPSGEPGYPSDIKALESVFRMERI